MTRNRLYFAAAAGLVLAWAATDEEWGRAKVEKKDGAFHVQLENSRLRVTYGRGVEIRLRETGELAGRVNCGGRILRNATPLDYGNSKKALRLDFDGAIQEISIFRDSPVVEIDYPDAEVHVTDESGKPGQFVQFTESGWTIGGIAQPSGAGFGVMVPQAQVRSMKATAGAGGIERVVSGAHTAYYFAVTKGGDSAIRQLGGELAMRMIPRRASTVPFTYTRVHQPKAYTQIGDIDGDGRNDIVTRSADRLSWLHYPDYEPHLIKAARFAGDRYFLADMDGDGDLDIVASGRTDKKNESPIFWYENPMPRGKATGEWTEHPVGLHVDYVKDMKPGDLNRDGKLDIVVRSHGFTAIYFQKPGGQWTTKRLEHPDHEGMDLADLDGDGDLDIVLNGFWFETPANAETGEYARHTIDEKWFTQKTRSWRDNNAEVAVADINHDGIPDVVLAHSEQVGYPVSWYSVDSFAKARTGPWVEHKIAERFDWCQTLEIGDVDHDGNLDIVVSQFEREAGSKDTNQPPYPVVVYYNVKGDGSQWRAEQIGSIGIYSGALGDVGSDGSLDLVGPHSYFGGALELWQSKPAKLALDRWTYIQADDSRPRYAGKTSGGGGWFGLAAGDLTGDGYKDIVSGQWFYRNPGGDMTGKWERILFGDLVDAVLITDVNNNPLGDVIALKCNEQYWYEATDRLGNGWKGRKIGSLPVCNHNTGAQGYALAQIVPGGKPEILLTGKGIHYIRIPDDPMAGEWPQVTIAPPEMGNGEMLAAVDMDGDGDLDIVAAHQITPGGKPSRIAWFENPGDGSNKWTPHIFGETSFHADRIAARDLNGDGRPDVVVSEERYPGPDPDASLYWFEAPKDPKKPNWTRHTLATQYSMNSMDIGDLDRDGRTDIVVCEHKGTNQKLQVFRNLGSGKFEAHTVDRGKESHLGARLWDLDGDGDLDILSIGWDQFQYLHIWRNDAIRKGR